MLLLLLVLALAGTSRSRLINVTIDDTLGDERTGIRPRYDDYWWDEYPDYYYGWDYGAALTRDELSRAHNRTLSCRNFYHTPANASLTFNGTAVYFFIARRANASINMMFYRDGMSMPVYQYFVHPELPYTSDLESASKFLCNQLAFKDDQLANKEHTITFVLDGNTSYDACFDYAIYTEMSSWHMGEDVESLRVHLGREALDGLVGHSNGGCIALWYAIRFPKRVKKLVLLGSQLLGSAHVSGPATKVILDARPDRDAVDAFYAWARNMPSFKTDDEFAAGLHPFLGLYVASPDKHLDLVKAAFTNKPQLACMQAQAPAEAQHADQRPELENIVASTLIIVGQEDFICPVPVSEMIAAGIKDSCLHVMPNVGHFSWIEERTGFARILGEFFSIV